MDSVARSILSVFLGYWMLCAEVVRAAPPPDIPVGTTPRDYLEVLRGSFLTPQISSSRYYTLLLRDDASVWSCGSYPGPEQISGRLMQVLPPGTARWVSAGRHGSFAGVLAFRDPGGLGGAYTSWTYIPPVSGKPVAGFDVSYFVEDGQVMAIGRNDFGQLGNLSLGGLSLTYAPVFTDTGMPLTDVKMVAAGSAFATAVKRDGTVWTWGGPTITANWATVR